MKIEEVISGKTDSDMVPVSSAPIPVSCLKSLLKDGYENIIYYNVENTFSAWGKASTACFTKEQLLKRA